MGQIVGPWESQEGRSLYLLHPQLRIAHLDHGKSFTKSSLRSHIFAPSRMAVLYYYGSRRTTKLLIRQSNPLYLDSIISIFFVLLFLFVIPLYLLSPLTRYTYTYLSTDVVVRQILVFLFSLFFFSLSHRSGYVNQSSLSVPPMLLIICQIMYILLSKHATLLHHTLRTIIVQILSFS